MLSDPAPGLRTERLAVLIDRIVPTLGLDLHGRRVLTEAATGAYSVTPVIAAVAGATVHAVARSTRYGTVDDIEAATRALADELGVRDRITIHEGRPTPELVAAADVITNSGHVRPIDAELIAAMHPRAVVPLMFESWEIDLGRDDVDLGALRARDLRVAGTNERHPEIDVFSYLGPMAVKLLADAAVSTYRGRLLLLCDNPFEPYLVDGLRRSGAHVLSRPALLADDLDDSLDAIVVALRPGDADVLDHGDLALIAARSRSAVLAQFWGDIPRQACADLGLACAPLQAPGRGHMGVLPSAVGPEPIVRLQAGGLRVAQTLMIDPADRSASDIEFLDEL